MYHQISIRYLCTKRQNGNLVVHIKIANIYLFLKLTESQFGGLQICRIAITRKRKRNLSFAECTNREFIFQLCPKTFEFNKKKTRQGRKDRIGFDAKDGKIIFSITVRLKVQENFEV